MKKNIFLTFLLFIGLSLSAKSQEKLAILKNSLKTSVSDIKDVIPIVNYLNDDIALFIADAKNVYGYLMDKNFTLKNQLSSIEKRRKYKLLLGNSIFNNNDYRIFLSNKRKDKFISINFSFTNQKSSLKEFTLAHPSEKFIQSVTSKNQFYIIAMSEKYNSLYVYTFNNEGFPKRNRIDLNGFGFFNYKGNNSTLSKILMSSSIIKKIEENIPNSIETTGDSRKMYLKDHTILFTFDQNSEQTQTLTIDLNSLKASVKRFDKPLQQIKRNKKKTNTYINGNNLFSLATTKNLFVLNIIDLKTKKLIKEFVATKEEKIPFKNTPIIQEGGFYSHYRELEKTKKFLRKINAGKVGVSIQKYNNYYHMTIGGYIEQRSSGMMPMGMGIGIPIASFGNVSLFFNPAQFAYSSYLNTKSIRIESLLDLDFNHQKGKIKDNAFDKMKAYSRNGSKVTDIVFKYKDFFIQGIYSISSKEYHFIKFTSY